MEMEHATAASGQTLRARVSEWAQRARELGCESRGPVKVDESGVYAFARREGGVEIWHRVPTAAETRALVGYDAPIAPRAPAVRVVPKTASAKRVAALFGGAR
jgi:hypothetical protein